MATILIVDDHPVNRQLLVKLVGYAGHRAVEAADGLEALEAARKEPPDAVITDISMPRMDGTELVRAMRNLKELAETPVLFYTASYRVRDAQKLAEELHIEHVLHKPAKPAEILRVLRAVLGPGAPSRHAEPAAKENAGGATESLRLAAFTELALDLTTETDPQTLLTKFCHATRYIIEAGAAGIAIFDNGGRLLQNATLDDKGSAPSAASDAAPRLDALQSLLQGQRSIRLVKPVIDLQNLGLPRSSKPVQSFMVAGLPLPGKVEGSLWLYLVDKSAAREFNQQDESLAVTLATQVAVTYQSAWLHAEALRRTEELAATNRALSLAMAERQRAEEALRKLNEELELRVHERTSQLEFANRELEAFSYSVSHDLRAPLRAIDGFSRILIKDYAAALPEEARSHLEDVRANAAQMRKLVDDLLAFSHLSRQQVKKVRVDAGQLVRECLNDLQKAQEGRRLTIRVAGLPCCQADPALVKQVWLNLLGNALKYTGKRDLAAIDIGCQTKEGQQVFFVKDNGVGFDMRYAHKLFGVFQRLHRAEDYEGTGVGLAIVQRIIHRHGGKIWANAHPDEGATFYFTLDSGGPGHAQKSRPVPLEPAANTAAT